MHARHVTDLLVMFLIIGAASSGAEMTPGDTAGIQQTFGSLPLYFIENQGQIDSDAAAYYVKGADKTLYFTPDGITFSLKGNGGAEAERWTTKLSFVGANAVTPVGQEQQQAVFSYFTGKPEDWKTGLATYSKLAYEDLWPGIDLVYSGTVNELKYEFIVEPGADPGLIRLEYSGVTDASVTETGALRITTPEGSFDDDAPYAYQVFEGRRKEVSMHYALEEESGEGSFSYGFDLGSYDPEQPLILDPSMLVYCGYVGGNNYELGLDVAVDVNGNAYVVGTTDSNESTFPVKIGPDLTYNFGWRDAFIAKINPQGTDFVYCGYIGGDNDEAASGGSVGVAVDGQGNAYVTGITNSDENTFPVTVGPDLTYNGRGDAYIAKVNAQGTGLDYCGYIGGTDDDRGYDIAVDSSGSAYVAGYTLSDELSFPVIVGPDLTINGDADAFVAKINSTGKNLDYCGYIGGVFHELASGVAVDSLGRAYVSGWTYSDESTFPATVGPDLTYNGNGDAFVARISSQGTGFDYCGYIGGSDWEMSSAVAGDAQGSAYVSGQTLSDESSFPVKVGPDLTYNAGGDGFVAKLNPQGTGFDYCGYIGGAFGDAAHSVDIDMHGNAYLSGGTGSAASSFPVTLGPDLSQNGRNDVFVAMVNASGTSLGYCGYIGGSDDENTDGIAVDMDGNALVSGWTSSDEKSFPVIGGPDLIYNGKVGFPGDAFIAKVPAYHIILRSGNVNAYWGDPADVLFVNGSAGDDAYRTIVNPAGAPVTIAMDAPPYSGPNPAPFALYAWPGEAGAVDVAVQPYDIGTACFPMPLSNGAPTPPPYTLVNNIGYSFVLGYPKLPGIPRAPTYIIQNMSLSPGTWTLQGIIYDNNAPVFTVSLTNAIVLKQQ